MIEASFHARRETSVRVASKLTKFSLNLEHTKTTLLFFQEEPTANDSFREIRGVVKKKKSVNGECRR